MAQRSKGGVASLFFQVETMQQIQYGLHRENLKSVRASRCLKSREEKEEKKNDCQGRSVHQLFFNFLNPGVKTMAKRIVRI